MAFGDLFQSYLNRLEEARLYLEQGLGEGAGEIVQEILDDLEKSDLSAQEKSDLKSRIELEYGQVGGEPEAAEAPPAAPAATYGMAEPDQTFEYGLALMDGQFWDEAIREFKTAAAVGFRVMHCWELCGDCAGKMAKWDEAIRYYENIYADPAADEVLKRQILLKITKCSQTQKKLDVSTSIQARSDAAAAAASGTPAPPKKVPKPSTETFSPSLSSLDQHSIDQMMGQHAVSWSDSKNSFVAEKEHSYTISNLLHVGVTSVVLQVTDDATGEMFAGQILSGPYSASGSPAVLSRWARAQMMSNSQHVVRVHDIALCDERIFIVREHLPLSLVDIFNMGEVLPIPLAIGLAYQILEGIGDLHLHMGRDEEIRKIYHLDLRPSKVLLHDDRFLVKICNGGLLSELERVNPRVAALKHLPLPFLAYRAPEQFRPYLARKKPPFFTDIYLFGALLYEMLTGIAAFSGSSFEEYEIQHCEQYPTPPKVWRPEIPEALNDIIMNCLLGDPMKRWRSATQISLIFEKSFSECVGRGMDRQYFALLERLKAKM
jgi:eukaryotic-like serine/threonine-protein kinase